VLEGLELVGQGLETPPAFRDEPRVIYDAAVSSGLEGVVCKRLGSIYEPGRRSLDWIKVPVALTQEVVLIGWRPGEGRRSGMIGSLLLAVPDAHGDLAYAGKVGTGFTETALRDLQRRLEPIARTTPPIEGVPRPDARAAQWLEPTLVGEVTFRNWTPDGRLRHPSWRGLRPDRDPDDLARVQP
jgi:bifunctional non-homologous end joining protein LigD